MMFYLSAYSENRYIVYRSAVLKNNRLETVDIIFINKVQFIFSFSDLRNLVKCMDSMFPCYSLLNMVVIWLYMVFLPLPLQWGDLIWSFAKILSNSYYYITTFSLFHFCRNSQYSQKKWSVSFKNFFSECECISCYLPISSNLQFQF